MTLRDFLEGIALLFTFFFFVEARARKAQALRFLREAREEREKMVRERVEANAFRLECLNAVMTMGKSRVAAEASLPAPLDPKKRHLKLVN